MDIAFRMCLQVDNKESAWLMVDVRLSQFGIVHQQSGCPGCCLLGKTDEHSPKFTLFKSALHIKTGQISCEAVGIIQHAIRLSIIPGTCLLSPAIRVFSSTCRNGEVALWWFPHYAQRAARSQVSQRIPRLGWNPTGNIFFHYRNQVGSSIIMPPFTAPGMIPPGSLSRGLFAEADSPAGYPWGLFTISAFALRDSPIL